MSCFRRLASLVLGMACMGSELSAQQAGAVPPGPGPEHQKLAYFAGRWNSAGEMKASPFGPGGKFSGTDSCDWFAGSFHIVCRGEMKGPAGEMKGLGILGYDRERRQYTYYGIDNSGMAGPAVGVVEGDTWRWEGENLAGGQLIKTRYTIRVTSPTEYRFTWEMQAPEGAWTTVMEGRETRGR